MRPLNENEKLANLVIAHLQREHGWGTHDDQHYLLLFPLDGNGVKGRESVKSSNGILHMLDKNAPEFKSPLTPKQQILFYRQVDDVLAPYGISLNHRQQITLSNADLALEYLKGRGVELPKSFSYQYPTDSLPNQVVATSSLPAKRKVMRHQMLHLTIRKN